MRMRVHACAVPGRLGRAAGAWHAAAWRAACAACRTCLDVHQELRGCSIVRLRLPQRVQPLAGVVNVAAQVRALRGEELQGEGGRRMRMRVRAMPRALLPPHSPLGCSARSCSCCSNAGAWAAEQSLLIARQRGRLPAAKACTTTPTPHHLHLGLQPRDACCVRGDGRWLRRGLWPAQLQDRSALLVTRHFWLLLAHHQASRGLSTGASYCRGAPKSSPTPLPAPASLSGNAAAGSFKLLYKLWACAHALSPLRGPPPLPPGAHTHPRAAAQMPLLLPM